jgi:hypothetical protein
MAVQWTSHRTAHGSALVVPQRTAHGSAMDVSQDCTWQCTGCVSQDCTLQCNGCLTGMHIAVHWLCLTELHMAVHWLCLTELHMTTGCIAENCAVLGHYAACNNNFVPTFWDNLSVPSFFLILTPEDNNRLSRNVCN